ncbi:hypothetical protein NEOLEDRAFT_1150079 [Neolentinus lepideus HHB14362 ss-1]|uniref:Uncharacterized protein n=1 Tax=Neolentinus lepideus HHB14362 ss-1 TaxID=1314782 RepID=A0A165QGH9_9AGAM|nr:hypothetical protein NEOLEDRAFT_1150079 [Neolentinus lepideus HHB14362 ss-1]
MARNYSDALAMTPIAVHDVAPSAAPLLMSLSSLHKAALGQSRRRPANGNTFLPTAHRAKSVLTVASQPDKRCLGHRLCCDHFPPSRTAGPFNAYLQRERIDAFPGRPMLSRPCTSYLRRGVLARSLDSQLDVGCLVEIATYSPRVWNSRHCRDAAARLSFEDIQAHGNRLSTSSKLSTENTVPVAILSTKLFPKLCRAMVQDSQGQQGVEEAAVGQQVRNKEPPDSITEEVCYYELIRVTV